MHTPSPIRRGLVAALPFLFLATAFAPSLAHADADRAVATELVKLVVPPAVYDAMLDQSSKQLAAAFEQQGMKLPAGYAAKLRDAVKECIPYDEELAWSVDIYARKFTTDELKQLMVFYKTPVGQKAARLLPEISGEVARRAGEVMPQRMPAALKKHGLVP